MRIGVLGLPEQFGPADWVTLARAVLACGVAALTAASFVVRPAHVTALVTVATVALVLDWVDGQVARRTGTASEFGAAFDMEVDAFLVLVLSVFVARWAGPWVLLAGTARYLLLVAGWWLPWLRAPMPERYWAKVVAATQGIVLVVAAADVLPKSLASAALVAALLLLAASFGHQVWWLRPRRIRSRRPAGVALTVLSVALVWAALTGPNRATDLTPWVFLRVPLEGLVLAALLLAVPRRPRTATATVVGVALGAVLILELLDMAFYETLDRPFDPVVDWGYLGPLIGLVVDSVGRTAGVGVLGSVALLVVALLLATPLAVLRLTRIAVGHRRTSWQVVGVATAIGLLASLLGLLGVPAGSIVSTSASSYAVDQVKRIPREIRDERAFARATAADPLGQAPAGRLLRGLRGKDVLFVFVESYGRVAVQGSTFSPGVDEVLDQGTRRLRSAGFSARSAFLTSPTFGGISWLAHSTLQSGLWVDSQQRYSVLMKSSRSTLSRAFHRAGWRTVSDVPSDTRDWPEGRFYGYDRFYDSRNVGYAGPRFGYPTMPDQFTLDAFHRLELAHRPRRPVMAEIDLVSSHAPWSRTPHLVDQRAIGDGSLFDGMPQRAPSKSVIWRSAQRVRDAYGQSIQYSLGSVVDFVRTYGDDDLVVVMLGDHQPATIVSGSAAGHDVPVTVLAHDPAVLRRISSWHWQAGMRPRPDAPVWRMDAFRDRFLTAFD